MRNKLIILQILAITSSIIGCSTNHPAWMDENSQLIDNKTITQIPIPGSHLANAYEIDGKNQMCIGEVESGGQSQNAKFRQDLINSKQLNESKFINYLNTQDDDVSQQLKHGMRYLELQVCFQDDHFYTSNIYLTQSMSNIITQIKKFLRSSPHEIIILDFDNNLWSKQGYMNSEDLNKFYDLIVDNFDTTIVPNNKESETIGELKNSNYQIILLSSNPILYNKPYVWNKNEVAMVEAPEYATIKKITILENTLENSESMGNKFKILPVYSDTIQNSQINSFDNSNENDWVIFKYLEENIHKNPSVVITNNSATNSIVDIILPDSSNNNPESSIDSKSQLKSDSILN